MDSLVGMLPILAIILVFYFFMIRPQMKRQKDEQKFQSDIKKGDKIVTIGGIHGKVHGVQDTKIILEIGENTRITIDKHAISKEKSSTKLAEKKS
tara:strand:+ start:361 stop:645 length:285 start_codon:yes stop_codon:yes gene_type:complete